MKPGRMTTVIAGAALGTFTVVWLVRARRNPSGRTRGRASTTTPRWIRLK